MRRTSVLRNYELADTESQVLPDGCLYAVLNSAGATHSITAGGVTLSGITTKTTSPDDQPVRSTTEAPITITASGGDVYIQAFILE